MERVAGRRGRMGEFVHRVFPDPPRKATIGGESAREGAAAGRQDLR